MEGNTVRVFSLPLPYITMVDMVPSGFSRLCAGVGIIFAFASEAPDGEDTVYYGKSVNSDLNQIPCATAENPDKNIAMEEDEDTV